MSNRLWSGFCLTPWLLATGCTSLPPGSAASPQLPLERKLAIAQTFERQGRTGQAREIYEQILAAEPNAPLAEQRLESLMARIENTPTSRTPRSRSAPPVSPSSMEPRHPLWEADFPVSIADEGALPGGDEFAGGDELAGGDKLAGGDTTASPVSDDFPGESPAAASSRRVRAKLNQVAHQEPISSAASIVVSPQTEVAVEVPPAPEQPADEQVELADQASDAIKSDVVWHLPLRKPSHARIEGPVVQETDDESSPDEAPVQALEPAQAPEQAPTEPALEFELPESVGIKSPLPPVSSNGVDGFPQKLQHLFGTFNPEMLDEVRENRLEFQAGLLAIAADPDVESRYRARAVFLLSQLGPNAIDVVTALKAMMNSVPDTTLRIETAEAILTIQPENEEAIRVLLDLLKSGDAESKWYAAFALRMGASAHPSYANFAVHRLMESMNEGDVRLKRMAMLSLGAFGPAAEKALPQIEAALEDPDEMSRIIASTALKLIKGPVVPQEMASRQAGVTTTPR